MITIETRNNPQFLIDKLIAFLNEKSIDIKYDYNKQQKIKFSYML